MANPARHQAIVHPITFVLLLAIMDLNVYPFPTFVQLPKLVEVSLIGISRLLKQANFVVESYKAVIIDQVGSKSMCGTSLTDGSQLA